MQHSEEPVAERVKLAEILGYVFRSRLCMGLIALVIALALAECIWDGFRSFGEDHPFGIGAFSSLLFIVLGAVSVDLYLRERDDQRHRLELERERKTWNPFARRVFDELHSAVGDPSGVVHEALMTLWKAEAHHRKPDLKAIARPIEEASKSVLDILLQHLPLMVLRPELTEVARNTEGVVVALETATLTVRYWKVDAPDSEGLKRTIDYLAEKQKWFRRRKQENTDELIAEFTSL